MGRMAVKQDGIHMPINVLHPDYLTVTNLGTLVTLYLKLKKLGFDSKGS